MRQKSVPEKEPATQVVKNIRRVRRTLEKIGIPRATFYRWYDLYRQGGLLDEPDDFKLFGGGVPHRGDTSRRKTRSVCEIEPVASGLLLDRGVSALQAATPMVISASTVARVGNRERNILRTHDIAPYSYAAGAQAHASTSHPVG